MGKETKDTVSGSGVIYSGDRAGDSVSSESTQYETWMDRSLLPRSLYGGTKAMKDSASSFIAKHPLESNTAYRLRLSMSVLFNAYMKTAGFLAGQIFQSNLIFDESVSEDLQKQLSKCDAKGNDINVFSKRVFINGLSKGVSHILVEAPKAAGDNLSRADEKQLGIRPYFREIKPEDVIGWIVGEAGDLEQVRFKESVPKRIGTYGFKTVSRIRVYNNDGTWEIHEEEQGGGWGITDSGKLSYPGIPLVTFIPGEEATILTGDTPLMDLAELNLTHYQSYSDQRNILSVARVPILFGRHIELKSMPVGVAEMIISDDDNSVVEYVEITGNSIKAGAADVEDIERKMSLWGLQQLLPSSTPRTATEKSLNSRESNSALSTWATEFERCLQSALEIFMTMQSGQFPEEGVSVNREFSLGILGEGEGDLLVSMKKNGILASENVFDEFQRRGIIHESVTWEDVQALKEKDSMGEENSIQSLAKNLFGQPQTPGQKQVDDGQSK